MTTHRKTLTPLAKARKDSGFSFSRVHRAVYDRLGEFAPTEETIRTYHTAFPKNMNVVVLVAIADVYGMTAKEAAPELADHLETSRDLLNRAVGWFGGIAAEALQPA